MKRVFFAALLLTVAVIVAEAYAQLVFNDHPRLGGYAVRTGVARGRRDLPAGGRWP